MLTKNSSFAVIKYDELDRLVHPSVTESQNNFTA
jgi:hypothetical protein